MSAAQPEDFHAFLERACAQNQLPASLKAVLQAIAAGCLKISAAVRLGALAGILGDAGSENVQHEAQKKLDVLSDDILVQTLQNVPQIAGLASEENENFIAAAPAGEYLVLFDPLDGSSNIDVNISVGTIFSVLPRTGNQPLTEKDFLQAGKFQAAAGYVLYGVQTQLVLSWGNGVFAFTLDNQNTFRLTGENLKIPENTQEFAINMSNYRHWETPVRDYIDALLAGKTGVRGKDFNMRWVASMVAEVHRILTRGGVFLYPRDARDPTRPGKLRLMYEANPMAFLVTQAGGAAGNALQDILEIVPEKLHQRVAVILGAKEEVARLMPH